MAIQIPLSVLLVMAAMSWSRAHGQTTDIPHNVPPLLLPVMCILLTIVVLALCLIGFMLICVSAAMPLSTDEEEYAVGGNGGNTQKPLSPKHMDNKNNDGWRTKGAELSLKVENELQCSNDVIINMDPCHHDGCKLKHSTTSLLQGICRGGLNHTPTPGNVSMPDDSQSGTTNRLSETKAVGTPEHVLITRSAPNMSGGHATKQNCSLSTEGEKHVLLHEKVTGVVTSTSNHQTPSKKLWRIESRSLEQAVGRVSQDTELIVRG